MILDKNNLPRHVAFIMDGNRRYARAHKLPELHGHLIGDDRIEPIIDRAIELGIPYLTFWAFSTENWKRDKEEINFLLNLFRENLDKQVDQFHQKNVRIRVIGNIAQFPRDIQEKTTVWMEKTKDNTKITVNVALSYGGRDELTRAVNNLRTNSKFQIPNSKITEEDMSNSLDTAGQPDPELIIRTGGEQRLSGFLIWQAVYSELYFTHLLWPEFTPEEFEKAILWYQDQKRNFGK